MTHLKNIKFPLFVFAILIVFAACKSKQQPEPRNIQLLADSSAYNNNTSSDTSRMTQANVIPPKGNVQHEHVNSSSSHHTKSQNQVENKSTSGTVASENSGSNSNSGTVSDNGSSSTQGTKKKGWSKAAQGAVIGGVGGAIGGAIISKKKGTGAAIGGAVGAAGGYIIGRGQDKKDGRVKK